MQTTYTDQSTEYPALKGGLADAGITNKVTGESAAVIEFGRGLARLSTDLVGLPPSTGFTFAGVALMKHKAQSNSLGRAQYAIGEAIPIIRKGRVWVYTEQAVDPTLAVYLRHTVNSTLVPGDFRVDADTAKADVVANAKWASVRTDAGLALLELNLP
jgi:hypothetical protein